jgi:hypothetical protein
MQEVNERAFLFGWELGPNPHGLGRVVGIDLNHLGILGWAEGTRRYWLVALESVLHHHFMKPLELGRVGDDGSELEVLAATVVRLF